jgi:hypothetical protein
MKHEARARVTIYLVLSLAKQLSSSGNYSNEIAAAAAGGQDFCSIGYEIMRQVPSYKTTAMDATTFPATKAHMEGLDTYTMDR